MLESERFKPSPSNLFTSPRLDVDGRYYLNPTTIAHAARPIVEFVHKERPDAIIAADRGARLIALAVHHSWRYRYPDERFPTLDGKIHFARLSRKSLGKEKFSDLLLHTFRQTGICTGLLDKPISEARVMLMDDWTNTGDSLLYFRETLAPAGIQEDNVSFAAMTDWGSVPGRYVAGEEGHKTHGFFWAEYTQNLGVRYIDEYRPQARYRADAAAERRELHESIRAYYQRFVEQEAAHV